MVKVVVVVGVSIRGRCPRITVVLVVYIFNYYFFGYVLATNEK